MKLAMQVCSLGCHLFALIGLILALFLLHEWQSDELVTMIMVFVLFLKINGSDLSARCGEYR